MKSLTITSLSIFAGMIFGTGLSVFAQTPMMKGEISGTGKAALGPPSPAIKASVLPPEEIASYWRATSDVNLAQLNFEHRFGETPEARAVKDAGAERQKVIEKLSGMCGPGRVLQSATDAEAVALKVPKDTPICAPVAGPSPASPPIPAAKPGN